MKAIQISLDEGLLARIEATQEARDRGRSYFLRQAAEAYLRHLEQEEIRRGYEAGYDDPDRVAEEAAWPESEQAWPRE